MLLRELLECYKELLQYEQSFSSLVPLVVPYHPSLVLAWKFIKHSQLY